MFVNGERNEALIIQQRWLATHTPLRDARTSGAERDPAKRVEGAAEVLTKPSSRTSQHSWLTGEVQLTGG